MAWETGGIMSNRAGTPAQPRDLVDLDALLRAYESPAAPDQPVVFGTSGHRGSSLDGAFTDTHIAAITQAIVEYRATHGVHGPVFVGADTHALSAPAHATALEVLAANGITAIVDADSGWVPTPSASRAIIRHNRALPVGAAQADGIIITPSHNPPRDGGFKYNPPHGGPADSDATGWIAGRANEIIAGGSRDVRRGGSGVVDRYDYRGEYVRDLSSVLNLAPVASSGLKLGADPLGGASVDYWALIASHYGLPLTVVNPSVDPQWGFMTLDWDEKIRMDPSSPSAMASVVARRGEFDLLTGNDADADRHGIVTPDGGLMNPNHFLAVAIQYLFTHRDGWSADAAIGKTLVSSTMIDRVAGIARAAAARGAGRLQVVRAGVDRRLGRVRRGRECGSIIPRARRLHLDDRQGRHPARSARRRDPRGDGALAVASCTPTSRPSSVLPPTPEWMRQRPRRRRRGSESSRVTTSTPRLSRVNRSPLVSRRHRATERRSAA